MSDTATIFAHVTCPRCDKHLLNSVRCSWGSVPGMEYKVGDPVQWLRDEFGNLIKPFELRKTGPRSWRWNCGDPRFTDVYVFDEDVYTGNHQLVCPACGTKVAACIAHVRSGAFQQVRAVEGSEVDRILGDSRDRANVAILNEDGSFVPREDWFDCPVEYKKDQ